jgi:hypothetical protein
VTDAAAKSGGLGLLVGMGRPTGEEPSGDVAIDDEDEGAPELDDAAIAAATEVREAMTAGTDEDFARALRRFVRIAG